jgi:DNA-binding MarR family transcriptional regulator
MESGELLGREFSESTVLFHESVARKLGMTVGEWKCLDLLNRHGPLTAKRLADRSGLTTGAITGIVDRLEKLGYVRRGDNPGDRRSVIIIPMQRPDLTQTLGTILQSLRQATDELLRSYDEKEIRAIRDFLTRSIEIMHNQRAKLLTEDNGSNVTAEAKKVIK